MHRWLIIALPLLVGCKSLNDGLVRAFGPNGRDRMYVRAYVSAFTDEKYTADLAAKPTLNFRYTESDDIKFVSENQEITRACKDAAAEMGYKVEFNKPDCTDCLDVYLTHRYKFEVVKGTPQAFCSTIANSYTFMAQTYCSSWVPEHAVNSRWVALGFYSKKEKRPIHKVLSYSEGSIRSVIRVARELCMAGLMDFPERFEENEHTVEYGAQARK